MTAGNTGMWTSSGGRRRPDGSWVSGKGVTRSLPSPRGPRALGACPAGWRRETFVFTCGCPSPAGGTRVTQRGTSPSVHTGSLLPSSRLPWAPPPRMQPSLCAAFPGSCPGGMRGGRKRLSGRTGACACVCVHVSVCARVPLRAAASPLLLPGVFTTLQTKCFCFGSRHGSCPPSDSHGPAFLSFLILPGKTFRFCKPVFSRFGVVVSFVPVTTEMVFSTQTSKQKSLICFVPEKSILSGCQSEPIPFF